MSKVLQFKPMVFALGALGMAVSSAQAGSTIELGYVVNMAGATVMKAAYSATIDDSNFQSSLAGKTSGVSNMLSGYKMNWTASGLHSNGSFSAQTYENARKKKSKKAKSTGIVWQTAGVSLATGDPLPSAVAAALKGTSSDPLTAVLKMATAQNKKPCSGKFRVYDGRDVYDLSLSFKKKITMASAAGIPGLECSLTSTPVAGRAVDEGETKPDTYGLTLAPIMTNGQTFYIPVRIAGSSKGLSVVVSASSLIVDGQAVSAAVQ